MLSSIDMFIGFMLFLVCYGIYLRIWNQSRTTILMIVFLTVLAFLSKFCSIDVILLLLAIGLFMLFVRAVFRKYIIKSRWRELFYA